MAELAARRSEDRDGWVRDRMKGTRRCLTAHRAVDQWSGRFLLVRPMLPVVEVLRPPRPRVFCCSGHTNWEALGCCCADTSFRSDQQAGHGRVTWAESRKRGWGF